MKSSIRSAFLALALLATVAPPAFAWGALGHRLVGHLAEDDLSSAARTEIAGLLAGEPEPSLAGISTWADELRANDPDLGRRSAPWHYVTMRAPDCGYDAARDCPDGNCVVGAIEEQARVLADRSRPLDARRRALKFVVHFVGDIHQPLHANNHGDKGGNTVQLRVPTPGGGEKGSNLHSFWDSGLIGLTGLDEPQYLARLRVMPLAVALPRPALPPAAGAWASQSCAIAMRPGLYPEGARPAPGYAADWTPVVDVQLRRAGAQLAHVLNAALAR